MEIKELLSLPSLEKREFEISLLCLRKFDQQVVKKDEFFIESEYDVVTYRAPTGESLKNIRCHFWHAADQKSILHYVENMSNLQPNTQSPGISKSRFKIRQSLMFPEDSFLKNKLALNMDMFYGNREIT